MQSQKKISELTCHTESTPLTSRVHKQIFNSSIRSTCSINQQSPFLQPSSRKQDVDETATNPECEQGITTMPLKVKKAVKKSCNTTLPTSTMTKVDASKYRAIIKTKKSQASTHSIPAYGIATSKGFKNNNNVHYMTLHLGRIKNILLVQSYDGNASGKFVHEKYPQELMAIATNEIQKFPEKFIHQAYGKTQAKLCQFQNEKGEIENSGCSLLSVVITDKLISVANCGCSVAICQTKSGALLTLNSQHHTTNQSQVERISNAGGKLYQSVVEVSKSQLQIEGPLRVFPSGLIYTRTLGKYYEHKKQYLLSKSNNTDLVQGSRLMWQPQIKYINSNQVRWLGLFSESVARSIDVGSIRDIVNQESQQKEQKYKLHDIAESCSKAIVKAVLDTGTCDYISAAILFIGDLDTQQHPHCQQLGVTQGYERSHINRSRMNSSKGYITNRSQATNRTFQ